MKASRDSLNPGHQKLYAAFRSSPQVPFVDDTANCQTSDNIEDTVRDSVLAAYLIFGFPSEDPERPPINAAKWIVNIDHTLKYLGLRVNTRSLTVEWPQQK